MNGNSYVTGYFSGGDTLKFDNVFIVASSTLNEVFVAKFESAGNDLWGKATGSTAETTAFLINFCLIFFLLHQRSRSILLKQEVLF
jgi:hypothetical protein